MGLGVEHADRRHLRLQVSASARAATTPTPRSQHLPRQQAGKIGGYARRQHDWMNQCNSAKSDINALIKQMRGAQIRAAIAQKE